MFVAAQEGHADIVRCLLGAGAAVNQAMPDGRTPLYFAAWAGHVDVVRCLLSHGATADKPMQVSVTILPASHTNDSHDRL